MFSLVWQPGKMEWYIDAVRYASMDPSSRDEHAPDPSQRAPWPFGTESVEQLSADGNEGKRNPFYLILNAAIGGTCGGSDVPPLDLPEHVSVEERAKATHYTTRAAQVLVVDYVRVYQRRPVGQDGPYVQSAPPRVQPLPIGKENGDQLNNGTGNECVTAHMFPATVPASGYVQRGGEIQQ